MKHRNKAVYKTIRGVEHKLCTGPLHREGKFVPIDNFYKKKSNRAMISAWCKPCEFHLHGAEPRVAYSTVKFAVEELVFRLGVSETTRRLGVGKTTVWDWRNGRRKKIRREMARRIVLALAEARKNEEARHRKSIRHGAAARGRTERVPTRRADFNGKDDYAVSVRGRHRNENRDHENEIARIRRERKKDQLTTESA